MIRHRQQGSNWLYRLTSSVVSLYYMSNNPVVADQDTNAADTQNSDDAITTGTEIAMITLVLLFAMVSFVSFIRRRSSRNASLSKDWKILDDLEPEQGRYVPSPQFHDSFSVNSPSLNNVVSYPDSVHTVNTKNSSRSTSFLNGDPDSRSESYSLRELSINSITNSKLPDVPPSLGDMPKFRTDSDTWEKYLEMMNKPEKLNEAVVLMGRTGHSPHSSRGHDRYTLGNDQR